MLTRRRIRQLFWFGTIHPNKLDGSRQAALSLGQSKEIKESLNNFYRPIGGMKTELRGSITSSRNDGIKALMKEVEKLIGSQNGKVKI